MIFKINRGGDLPERGHTQLPGLMGHLGQLSGRGYRSLVPQCLRRWSRVQFQSQSEDDHRTVQCRKVQTNLTPPQIIASWGTDCKEQVQTGVGTQERVLLHILRWQWKDHDSRVCQKLPMSHCKQEKTGIIEKMKYVQVLWKKLKIQKQNYVVSQAITTYIPLIKLDLRFVCFKVVHV